MCVAHAIVMFLPQSRILKVQSTGRNISAEVLRRFIRASAKFLTPIGNIPGSRLWTPHFKFWVYSCLAFDFDELFIIRHDFDVQFILYVYTYTAHAVSDFLLEFITITIADSETSWPCTVHSCTITRDTWLIDGFIFSEYIQKHECKGLYYSNCGLHTFLFYMCVTYNFYSITLKAI